MKDIKLREILIGSILSVFIALGEVYNGMVIQGSWMANDFSTGAALFLFFWLTIGNILLKKRIPNLTLNSPELLLIYIMMIVACTIPTMGLVFYLIPTIAAPTYFATADSNGIGSILPHIKSWLIPQGDEAIRYFFEGLPKGETIPWLVWLKPLSIWAIFLFTLYFVMICLMVILRKQWVERERLIYPLVHLPLEMADNSSFFKNRVMWLGFLIPFIMSLLIGLHHYFPIMPAPSTSWHIPFFRHTATLAFRISFPIIGFTYLINSDLAFSLWFFYLLQFIIKGYCNISGISPAVNLDIYSNDGGGALFSFLQMGAIIVLGFFIFWNGKEHFKNVFRKLPQPDKSSKEDDEILPYPVAKRGLILGVLFMVIWLSLSGLPWWVSIVFLLLALLIYLVITRLVCEGGLAAVRAPLLGSTALISTVGSSAVGPKGLAAFSLTQIWHGDIRTFVMASVASALKLTERINRKKIIFWAIMLTILLTFISSVWFTLKLGYQIGAINANAWFFRSGPQVPFKYAVENIFHPSGPYKQGWVLIIGGAAFTLFLIFMRARFLWWQLHPLGFAFCGSSLTVWLWFSIFLGWLLKFLLLRYGGSKVYQEARPFFLGLILGQFVSSGMWLIVDFFTKTSGNIIFSI